VQCGVREDRIESSVGIRERLGACLFDLNSLAARGFHHLRSGVDACDRGAGGGDAPGQLSVAAAEVENALTWPRCQQFQHAARELMDECAVAAVSFGVPGLGHEVLRVQFLS